MSDKKAKVPQLRFAGFTGDWEERKLGACFSERTESMQDGELISVTISNGIKKFSELGRHDNSNVNKTKYKKVCIGDIAYNSMRMWQGASGYSPYEGIVSPAYTVLTPNEMIDSKCISYLFKKHEMIHTFQVNSQGMTSDNWNLKYPSLSKIKIKISKYIEEQQKIAEYFSNLDNLITLQQRQLDTLASVKKTMLAKMFPKDGANVPEIRFAGFTGAWEERKFSETFIYLQNNSLSRADLNYEQGLVKNVHYGDVLIKFGEILDVEKAEIPFISNNEFTVSSTSLLQNGDVIIADAAEDETVGKCSEINGIEDLSVVSGLHTIPCRPKKTFATGYLGYYLNSSAYHDQLLPLIQGTKISSISKSALLNTDIIYPVSEQEQLQIGQFFQSLVNLITIHQRELNTLKTLKKSMLQQLFI